MRVGSLFTGIGGIDLGLERAGMEIVWQAECELYCQRVLRKHWPDVLLYDDVREVTANAPPIDLLAGGFPCQPVSQVGNRLAADDPRWLWPEFARIIGALRPKYILVENVRGLASAGLREILENLTDHGYDAEWEVVSAASMGAPHLRERLFLVAYPHGTRQSNSEGSSGSSSTRGRYVFGSDDACLGPRDWSAEPYVDRVVDGIPNGLDRLRSLGNAVVPQVAEFVGNLIMAGSV